jgi:hypothetical protein
MTAQVRPRSLLAAIKTLGAGWHHQVTDGSGARPRYVLIPGRHRELVSRPVDSVALRLAHDDGRSAVAVWVHDGMKWAFDAAWIWQRCTLADCPRGPQPHPDKIPTQVSYPQFKGWIT